MQLGKLVPNSVKCKTEDKIFATDKLVCYSGHDATVYIFCVCVSECDEPWDSDSHTALLKAAGSEVLSYCSCSTDAFFFIPCVPLLDNALIINGFGTVHCQDLLVMDSKQTSMPYFLYCHKKKFYSKQ